MAFYESVFIMRQDASSSDVEKIVENCTKIIESFSGTVIKTEYWGLRSLAYDIRNNRKGYYVLLCIEANIDAIKEMERKMRLNETVIRFLTTRVDKIDSDPSPILKAKDNDEILVDVTVNKDDI